MKENVFALSPSTEMHAVAVLLMDIAQGQTETNLAEAEIPLVITIVAADLINAVE